jgi:hypothetical protein
MSTISLPPPLGLSCKEIQFFLSPPDVVEDDLASKHSLFSLPIEQEGAYGFFLSFLSIRIKF